MFKEAFSTVTDPPDAHAMAEKAGDGAENLKKLASLLSIVAHPIRLMILESLLSGVRCVKDLNELIPISQPNLSQHMAALREAGLVEFESRGSLRCYYVIRPSLVEQLLELQPERHPAQLRSRESILSELDESR